MEGARRVVKAGLDMEVDTFREEKICRSGREVTSPGTNERHLPEKTLVPGFLCER